MNATLLEADVIYEAIERLDSDEAVNGDRLLLRKPVHTPNQLLVLLCGPQAVLQRGLSSQRRRKEICAYDNDNDVCVCHVQAA